jgi:hypothetical protein
MPARDLPNPTLVAEHVPDFTTEIDGNGVRHEVELPGAIRLGVDLGGHTIWFLERKAGKALANLDAATADTTPAE